LLSLLPSLALLAVFAIPTESFAQVRIGGGGISIGSSGYGRGGYGYGNPGFGYGGPGYGRGFGYGSGYGYGSPGVTFGRSGVSFGLGSGYGYDGYPRHNYGSGYRYNYNNFYPGYTPSYSGDYYGYPSPVIGAGYQQGVIVGGTTPGGYQSFYPAGVAGPQNDGSRATIRVNVPPDAQVLFNGSPTNQTGPQRTFVSPPLDQNNNYSYEVSARWTENGREVNRSRTVRFQPGQTVDVDLTAAEGSNPRQDDRPQGTNPQELSPRQDERPQQLNPGQNPGRPNPSNPANPTNPARPQDTSPRD
jgi:uncharacterized protein (TIGR03000 family)